MAPAVDHENHFGEYVHLRSLPRSDEALLFLRKIASCVKPIMRKRGWKVGKLCEFYPDEAGLLGLNSGYGKEISLRLRHHSNSSTFLSFETVLDTMLHELSHNKFGPHDDKFHKLWQELRGEWYILQAKGWSGEGFLAPGHALGGRDVPVDELRRLARAGALDRQKAADKARLQAGVRLGGQRAPQREIHDAVALAALNRDREKRRELERQREVAKQRGDKMGDQGCGSGNRVAIRAAEDALMNGFHTKSEMDSANDAAIAAALVDLMEEEEDEKLRRERGEVDDDDDCPPEGLTWSAEHGLQAVRSKPSSSASSAYDQTLSQLSRPSKPVSRPANESDYRRPPPRTSSAPNPFVGSRAAPVDLTSDSHDSDFAPNSWQCLTCTLVNSPTAHTCNVCEAARPQARSGSRRPAPPAAPPVHRSVTESRKPAPTRPSSIGWSCHQCGNFMEAQWWTCSQCGTMKSSS